MHFHEDSKPRREEEEGEKLATYIYSLDARDARVDVGETDHVALESPEGSLFSPVHNIIRYPLKHQSLSAMQVMLYGKTRY